MGDNDDVERERTTVVETGGGGGGGVLAVVLLIIVVLVLLFLLRGQLCLGGSKTTVQVPDKIDVNVNHKYTPNALARRVRESPLRRGRVLSGPRPFEFVRATH